MSKRKREDNLLAGGAITEEAMEAYLGNTLSTEERTQFEKLLADDPFAQDALEGMQAAPNRTETKTRIAGIKKKIRTQTGGKDHKTIGIHWVNYVWAAVVLGLLVGIGGILITYLNKDTDGSLAQNEAQQEIIAPVTEDTQVVSAMVADTAVGIDSLTQDGTLTTTASDTVSMAANYAANSVAQRTTNVLEEQKLSKKPAPAAAPAPTGNTGPATAKVAAREAVVKEEASKTKRAEPVKADDADQSSTIMYDAVTVSGAKVAANADKKKAAPKVEDTKAGSGGEANRNVPTQAEAMKNFNSGNYKESAEQFDAILKAQPNNADAQYFGGVSDYLNGKLSKSEKTFDKLLKGGNRYTEGSKWYKANILIQKGKKEDAKKILNELSNTNNSYKERATNKLKEL